MSAAAPLGVRLAGDGVNVAVWSAAATAVDICFFEGDEETRRVRLPDRTGPVWHGHVSGIQPGARYGLRSEGNGGWFNPDKLLIDPWALQLDRVPRLDASMFGPGGSGARVPKGIVVAPDAVVASPVLTPWSRTVIYELHVRGFTMLHPDIPAALRGRFAGLAHPAAIAHLTRLGVTAVELMPPSAWIEERHLARLGLTNYWGYNTIAPMAPDPRLAPEGWAEVRAAVAALAAAGIETLIDMVPNHSGEGDAAGPVLSLRGLDHDAYYRTADGRLVDDTGCGNTLALDREPGLRLTMDSLRAWVLYGGVHGFRFDLATVMGRREAGFDPAAPLLAAIAQDPLLAPRKMIAEPWDIGPGGYRLGGFAPGWGEWNDRFRDDVRRFWRGDAGFRGAVATRLAGSSDGFAGKGMASRSVNFVVAHDGFTLADLVRFTTKRNAANGEDNRDGTDANHAWNHGVEGPSDDPGIVARRWADQRALLATLIFARGTPMLAMGAELGHSQDGNNNAYAQDNATAWLDWAQADPALSAWTAKLVGLRRAHADLREDRFLTGGPDWDPDVAWRDADGALAPPNWDRGDVLVMVLRGRTAVVLNRGPAVRVVLPGGRWRVLADSAAPEASEWWSGSVVTVAERAVMLLVADMAAPADNAVLDRLAAAAGIAAQWWEVDGTRHDVSLETKRALLAAMRLPAGTLGEARDSLGSLCAPRALPEVLVRRQGHAQAWPLRGQVHDEAGRAVSADDLAPGRYTLVRGNASCAVIVAPSACYLPPGLAEGRRFGVAAQLYSLRRDGDQGIGDFGTLRQLVDATRAAGGTAVALNPLHALFGRDRSRASPYYPSDRRFIDPIYIDIGEPAPELCALTTIDYDAVWQRKRAALWRQFAQAGAAEIDAFMAAGGADLAAFTAFEAGGDPAEARFQAWLQMRADAGLAAAATGLEIGVIRDLAIGPAPDGAEARACADLLAPGVSIGAPPDPFSAQGQVWGVPPPDPHRMGRGGYAAFTALLRANLRHAGGLRIDHAMGLARLFWVPAGGEGRDGAYVTYPLDDLLGVLALESHRARAVMIGEDLGTVPEGFRERMAAENILGCRVLMLERDGRAFRSPAGYPTLSAASVSTHDLPTFTGWKKGSDIAERRKLGLTAGSALERVAEVAALAEAVGDASTVCAHAAVAASPACLMLVQSDDLAGETQAVNLPGTDRERPNWRRKLAPDVQGMFAAGGPILDAIRAGRVRPRSPG